MKVAGISGAVVIFEINADSAPQLIQRPGGAA
jgi:hypothetical protein